MFFRKWFAELRLRNERAVLERQGVWGNTPQTLDWLLQNLQSCTYKSFNITIRENMGVVSRSPNVDHLIGRIKYAVWILDQTEDVERETKVESAMNWRSLDQFLITNMNLPLKPETVIETMKPDLVEFIKYLLVAMSEDSIRSKYYLRQFESLVKEVRDLLATLMAVSDSQK